MPRRDDPWRDDALGALVRVVLADSRTASPSPRVWRRLEAAVVPSRDRRPVLERFLEWLAADVSPGWDFANSLVWLPLPGPAFALRIE